MTQINSHQNEATQDNPEIKQAEMTSIRKVKRKKNGTDTTARTKASDAQIRKANDLMMQAWDMISKRKNSDSNAQSDL